MTIKINIFLLGFLLVIGQQLQSQWGISGQIKIDTALWTPIAYLSLIPDFDDLNTISNQMILESAPIDGTGHFQFSTQYFPEEDNLFRIHIAKKGDPRASLIIGGKDENHFFLIANNKSYIVIKDTCQSELLRGIVIDGYYPNKILQRINELASYLDTTRFNDSPIKIELIRGAIFDKLRSYADTCSNPLLALYALYKSKFEKNYPINQQFYKNFLLKWDKERSTYFTEFKKKIPLLPKQKSWIPFLIVGLTLIIVFLLAVIYFKLSNKNQNPLHDLSVQERKIFALMMEGKSNKEISEILMIGLSTVKTHVNNIYSKLGINSRKDVLNLNLDNKTNGI